MVDRMKWELEIANGNLAIAGEQIRQSILQNGFSIVRDRRLLCGKNARPYSSDLTVKYSFGNNRQEVTC